VFTAVSVFLLFSLSGCDEKTEKADSAISEAKLSERETELLRTVTDQYFVYDYNVDSTYKKVSVWVEKYQSGKKVGEKISHMTAEIKEAGTLTYATAKTTGDLKETTFITGINGSVGVSSVTKSDLEHASSVLGGNPGRINPGDGELVLASLCYKKDGSDMRSLSSDFYRDAEKNIDELQNYETVYLFKSEFTQ